ncbi:choline O-acetyltransferase [Amyelois transitella]|uniref:choline O-acetyltransferase n=1 Tax=Amyelois transitella TaxID=680683 RepID=UPI00298FD61D|nr:choline O-acetyltransferase [Amyelois transitella]
MKLEFYETDIGPRALVDVEEETGALLGRLQGALRGRASAASPSRVASSIKGYLTNKVGSLQLRDSAWGESLLSLPKRWLSTQVYGSEEDDLQNLQLKKLPVPDLQTTMDSYLEFAAVIASPQQVEHTKGLVRGFMEELGPRLQEALMERQAEMDNWITDWWLDDMYLKVRAPLPINSNPGMVFPPRHFAKMEEVADLGALFIDDLLDYKEMLDRGELPLERATSREKGQPLCMEQFYRLLGVCRIPGVGKDELVLPSYDNDGAEKEELIIVACRNYFYPIPVKAVDRGRLNAGEIQAQILHAMVDAAGAPPAPRVGLLTSMNRDSWAKAREQLMKDENNRTNLELISRALCLLCIDEAGGDCAGADGDTNAMLRAMHGAGTAHHSANRWFDKTVQLLISSDGTLGLCYEHSPAEGVAVVRLAERVLARAEVSERPAPPSVLLPAPQAMKWNVTADVQRTIDVAARDLDRAIADLDYKVYTYRGYGREFMKSCRTSPDVYIQLALQYAYFKMYGYLTSTYESASLRRFRSGRVDNIRSAHAPAKAWADAMCSAEAPHADDDGQKKVSFNLYGTQKKLELFDEAVRKQTAIMEDNILGRGIDNHLLGLREAARETLGYLPQLFTDPVYQMMIEYKLSTSQVATTTEGTIVGYGPVVPDGYGCCYNPKKDTVIFCIASFHSSSVTNTEAFRQFLEEALDSMKLMLQNRKVD